MKQAKQALAMMVFAVTVGCSNQLLPATPPPATAEVLPVYHTGDTSLFVAVVATSDYETNHDIIVEAHSDNHQNLLMQLDRYGIPFFHLTS